jgi:hypothetical protein
VGQIISSAFSDAWPLFMSRRTVYVVFNMMSALGGFAAWFVIPAVIRTIDPSFRMTVARFFGLLGLGIVVTVVLGAVMGVFYGLGFVLFLKNSTVTTVFGSILMLGGIIVVFWIGIRWSQIAWAYFLGEPPNPFAASWRVTSGQFWPTLGFVIVLSIVTAVVLGIGWGIAAGTVAAIPVAGFITVPLGVALYIWLINVVYLAEVRWFLRLRQLASTGAGALPAH